MTRTRVMSRERNAECGFYAIRASRAPYAPPLGPVSPASARVPKQVSRELSAQSSVKASHALLSHATLSQAMLSHATLSQAKLSQATLFQTRVSQVSSGQKIPPNSGSFHCSGEPKS